MTKKITVDGNTSCAHVAYALSEVAAIYPITPSTPMAEVCDEWAAANRLNIFGQPLRVAEMQSEGGAAGAVHGSLKAGALTTTFTASQGLLLMIPNMYKIAGELLPCVFHVSARSLAYHALSIFGDHSDVMACRQTGFAMLASNSVQEAMDMALAAHLSTLEASVPFLHFFDGFRTSHEISKIQEISYDDIKKLVDYQAIDRFKARALNPEHPHVAGTAQNPDTYFQNREACNIYYNKTPDIVSGVFDKIAKLTGRKYKLFDYVGAPDATNVIVAMGSSCETAEEAINYLVSQGEKVGLVKVRLYRPFSIKDFANALPASVKHLTVLDRVKESGSTGDPLYLDAVAALTETRRNNINILCGRYGLASKEFTPSHVKAVLDNATSKNPKNHFTVGINDDVTNTSIEVKTIINTSPKDKISCKFYGLGSDGTVGANKNSIKIIGDNTDMHVQAYFEYDSKKSGGTTISHLRFGNDEIKSSYLITHADFLACHNSSYIYKYDILESCKEGGTFLLNSPFSEQEMETALPASMKRQIAEKKLQFYNIDAISIARQAGSAKSTNVVMQAAFFKLANIIPYAEAEKHMKDAVVKSYGKKGEHVVKTNFDAIDAAITGLKKINYPESWLTATTGAAPLAESDNPYYQKMIKPILSLKGNTLPVSAFTADGCTPTGTTAFEKRAIADEIPRWIPENCIQCNICSFVCPHAVIRPAIVADSQKDKPETFKTIPADKMSGYGFRMQISPMDCTGCMSCVNVCPSKQKALTAAAFSDEIVEQKANYEYSLQLPPVEVPYKPDTVKGSQFNQPLFEFSGACAGCGETPYVKLITQLFGDRMIVANATGCSSIYGGSSPTTPYTVNSQGHGPAWANSLFEDNAEFGYGINIAYSVRRAKLANILEKVLELKPAKEFADAVKMWLEGRKNAQTSKVASEKIKATIDAAIKNSDGELKQLLGEVKKSSDVLIKKSVWLFGGDGWAYDIGYGGLDHVIAQGEDINILVMDTEVYSNTGGQASKASPTGAVAKFAAAGKRTGKKDLGMMAMNYGNVYVAQVAMGYSYNQFLKAVIEAEAYEGTSLIIAYSTCISHGFNMSDGMAQTKRAVESGYWSIYRYNPTLAHLGKNPFVLDSKEPSEDYKKHLTSETRYRILQNSMPEVANTLFDKAEQEAKARIQKYKDLADK